MPGLPPLLLFGAFDRHNFGDLLFPHLAAAQSPGRQLIYAGLAARDLTGYGGHRVAALAALAAAWGDQPIEIFHVGGEILTCDAWQAAVMLESPDDARAAITRLEGHPASRRAWARDRLGLVAEAPYVIPRRLFPGVTKLSFNAVGGVNLDTCEPALRAEVLNHLAAADVVSVRDRLTLEQLRAAGIPATLAPDPVARIAELFGAVIHDRIGCGEIGRITAAFPQGYLAVQFSADYGDDATLAEIAAQLDRVAAATGLGLAFFRAGAAPWHDDADTYRRVVARLARAAARIMASLDIWDICALIAASRAFCGSSLHGRIVAMAHGLPRVSLIHQWQVGRPTKQAAYVATWEAPGMPGVVDVTGIAAGVLAALALPARDQ